MHLLGLQRLTLLDYPGRLACTVFTGGCNLRCPFCHNASLVLNSGERISEEEFFDFLESRRARLDGVCVSGGEPTLQADLVDFISKIKSLGFLVKLDTNGTRPEVIKALLAEGLLDYIAMDIKNSKARYAETVGIPSFDIAVIEKSVELIRKSGIPHEFRTTVALELHTADDIRAIGEWLVGAERYYLQKYRDEGDILTPGLTPPTSEEMEILLAAAREFSPSAEVR